MSSSQHSPHKQPDSSALWQLPEMQHPLQNTLRPIFISFLGVAISILAVALFLNATVTIQISALNIIVLTSMLWLLSKQYINVVGLLASGSFVFSAVYCQYIGDGIHDVASILLPIALGIAALLMDRWVYHLFSISVVAIAASISYAHNQGLLINARTENIAFVDYFISPMLLLAFALTIQKAAYHFRKALHFSELARQRYIDIFSATQDGIVISDLTGTILEANVVFQEITATGEIENILQLPNWPEHSLKTLQEHSQSQFEWTCARCLEKNQFVIRAKQIHILNTAQLLWVFQDVTEERKLQALAHRSDKLRLAGQLASGIAHDVNNQLTGIIGMVERYKAVETESPELQEHADKLIIHAHQVAEQLSQLLNLNKTQLKPRQRIDITQTIDNALTLTNTQHRKTITKTVETSAHNPYVMAHGTEIENVFVNLLINAQEAIIDAGEIRIQVSQADQSRPGVHIEISDTGRGMSSEELSRIFEPFFTTREDGTGLGLFMVYSIITAHNGTIAIQSEPQKGTRVQIWLPCHETERASPPPVEHQTCGHHILLIEDEVAIAESLTDYLEYYDYHVVSAQTGQEADLLLQGHAKFDAIIMDLQLPDRAGEVLFRSIVAQAPHTPLILISGFASEKLIQHLTTLKPCTYLAKPFRFEQLTQTLSVLIDVTHSSASISADPVL